MNSRQDYVPMVGDSVWIPARKDVPDLVYEQASVLMCTDHSITVRTNIGSNLLTITLPISSNEDLVRFAPCPKGECADDLVQLRPAHVANILHHLEQRSVIQERPYTFVGPVLITVNPIIRVDSSDSRKYEKDISKPHPKRIAEAAVQQLNFARHQNLTKGSTSSTTLNQGIVISGESGSGKTENAKVVLERLVELLPNNSSKNNQNSSSLDKQLLESNPILEAFGNAQTVRNPNSSRFGKFMKLQLTLDCKHLSSGKIQTYLLERPRVVHVSHGERNFHIFYIMLAGLAGNKDYLLPKKPDFTLFPYLTPVAPQHPLVDPMTGKSLSNSKSANNAVHRAQVQDLKQYKVLIDAMEDIGIDEQERLGIFSILASILHLGNLIIYDDEGGHSTNLEANVEVTTDCNSKQMLRCIASGFGLLEDELINALCSFPVKVGHENPVFAKRRSVQALRVRDSLAKHVYGRLFTYIVNRVNERLGGKEQGSTSKAKSSKKTKKQLEIDGDSAAPFIGVLDIFGFETFDFNDLEQLLINYTNEVLHSLFLGKVFDAELKLYQAEGLLPEEGTFQIVPPLNEDTLQLLHGPTGKSSGLLHQIAEQGRGPHASDYQMLQHFHKTLRTPKLKHVFPAPHPKDKDFQFKIQHYSGIVTYHIGNFIEKDHDVLDASIDTLLSNSTHPIVNKMWPSDSQSNKGSSKTTANKRLSLARFSSSSNRRSLGGSLRGLLDGGGKVAGGMNNQFGNHKQTARSTTLTFHSKIGELVSELQGTNCSFIRCIKPNALLQRELGSPTWFDNTYVFQQVKSLGIEPTLQVLSSGMPQRVHQSLLVDPFVAMLPKSASKAWKKYGKGDKRLLCAAILDSMGSIKGKYKVGFNYVFVTSSDLGAVEAMMKKADKKMSEKQRKEFGSKVKSFIMRRALKKIFTVVLCAIRLKYAAAARYSMHQASVVLQKLWRGCSARKRYQKILDQSAQLAAKQAALEEERLTKIKKRSDQAKSDAEKAQKKLDKANAVACEKAMKETLNAMEHVRQCEDQKDQAAEQLAKSRLEQNKAQKVLKDHLTSASKRENWGYRKVKLEEQVDNANHAVVEATANWETCREQFRMAHEHERDALENLSKFDDAGKLHAQVLSTHKAKLEADSQVTAELARANSAAKSAKSANSKASHTAKKMNRSATVKKQRASMLLQQHSKDNESYRDLVSMVEDRKNDQLESERSALGDVVRFSAECRTSLSSRHRWKARNFELGSDGSLVMYSTRRPNSQLPKGVFQLTSATDCVVMENGVKGNKHAIHLSNVQHPDSNIGDLYLGFLTNVAMTDTNERICSVLELLNWTNTPAAGGSSRSVFAGRSTSAVPRPKSKRFGIAMGGLRARNSFRWKGKGLVEVATTGSTTAIPRKRSMVSSTEEGRRRLVKDLIAMHESKSITASEMTELAQIASSDTPKQLLQSGYRVVEGARIGDDLRAKSKVDWGKDRKVMCEACGEWNSTLGSNLCSRAACRAELV